MDNVLNPINKSTVGYETEAARPAVVSTTSTFDSTSYVDWPAALAGTLVALAVGFVLLTFGASVGLSAVSPWTSTRGTVTAASWGAVLWLILSNIWSFGLGGYLAARMRHRRSGAQLSEVEFRDGAHGAIVWAAAVTTGAIIAALVAASIARGGVEVVSRNVDPGMMATDSLLRGNQPAANQPASREELGRVLANSVGSNGMASADRTYLAQIVAARAGIPQADAERRVDQTVTQMKDAVERARKTSVVVGFLTAATLLLGAAAAWWAAKVGGKHRDEGTIWAGLGGRVNRADAWTR